ncbi:hypothetical protein [Marinicella litoralis]|uniref:Transmembrane anchor protein n=1 Tax=Marinicella litoralis TaxID=644220 RepID=A0A4V6PXT7_9GAMM|nr:hypothetical protein [Marinicella litoralis]TDR17421.1 hypothetical protein C8D91_2479 [Marinicella litoralis]
MKQDDDIPVTSNKALIIATISALVLSVVVYFTIIMPAEYNIDPTGLGKKLGLTVLAEQVTEPIVSQTEVNPVPDEANAAEFEFREDIVMITVPANKGIEYKFTLQAFSKLNYEWKTIDASNIYFDFHGEPAGDTTGYFESFTIATTNQMQGSATVPFTGSHGWYWKNSTNQDVSIELKTSGKYQVKGLNQ